MANMTASGSPPQPGPGTRLWLRSLGPRKLAACVQCGRRQPIIYTLVQDEDGNFDNLESWCPPCALSWLARCWDEYQRLTGDDKGLHT